MVLTWHVRHAVKFVRWCVGLRLCKTSEWSLQVTFSLSTERSVWYISIRAALNGAESVEHVFLKRSFQSEEESTSHCWISQTLGGRCVQIPVFYAEHYFSVADAAEAQFCAVMAY